MTNNSGQKFIRRTRAPRVQIEYDVEINGAERKVNLPFVMGVMTDLSGQSHEPLPPLSERSFLEIDQANFDDRMKAMKPRIAANIPNKLTGEGMLGIDLTFESMDDFGPSAIAGKIEPLRRLLEARGHLANLLTYMDGKVGAEETVAKLLADEGLMKSLCDASRPDAQDEDGQSGTTNT
jgi:type VI secretion system protein ImpB